MKKAGLGDGMLDKVGTYPVSLFLLAILSNTILSTVFISEHLSQGPLNTLVPRFDLIGEKLST
jgi:hypothetical protein